MPEGRNKDMGMQGTGLTDTNIRLRFFVLIFGGLIAFGVVFYWRHQTIKQAEYVEFPDHTAKLRNTDLHSKNYQLEIEDASPAVQ